MVEELFGSIKLEEYGQGGAGRAQGPHNPC
ncbi:hypothetical protein CCACVL1_28544 [Corchorus capsularis]|uniref:Uncharacterized protein n=1 Tax=Corchorus capsularis TaxID=210143 RepID=A0A1R3G662_COCAP|nr:hypothetical protein CCACVL1_28544 [Corchorus capsularis]